MWEEGFYGVGKGAESLNVHCLDPQSVCWTISGALRVGGLIVGLQVKYKVLRAWGTRDLLSLLKAVL